MTEKKPLTMFSDRLPVAGTPIIFHVDGCDIGVAWWDLDAWQAPRHGDEAIGYNHNGRYLYFAKSRCGWRELEVD